MMFRLLFRRLRYDIFRVIITIFAIIGLLAVVLLLPKNAMKNEIISDNLGFVYDRVEDIKERFNAFSDAYSIAVEEQNKIMN